MSAIYTLPTLAQLRTGVRDILDEATATYWPDSVLNYWINEGMRNVARAAEDILSFNTSISCVAGQGIYALPIDVVRLHRVQYQATGDVNQYRLQASSYDEMDQVWAINQTIQSSYPLFFVIWGMPASQSADTLLNMQVFPVPAANGTFQIFYYRLPATLVGDGDIAEIHGGWDDLIIAYCEYKAKRRDRDPDWQAAKQEYDEKLVTLIDKSRFIHDDQQFIINSNGVPTPGWLYNGDW